MQHIAIPVSTTSGVGHVDIADEPADLGPEATRHHTARRISIVRLAGVSLAEPIIQQPAQVEDVKAVVVLPDEQVLPRDGRGDKTRFEDRDRDKGKGKRQE